MLERPPSINDTLVHEVAFILDVEAYFSTILGEELAGMFIAAASDMTGQGSLWISQEEILLQKAFIEMNLLIEGEPMEVTTEAAYYGANEPVDIPDPTATE